MLVMSDNGSKAALRRLLVVAPNWVGDLVLATPAFRAIRTRFAEAHIAMLVKAELQEVLAGGDWMNEVVFWPRGKTREHRRRGFLGLAQDLREQRFDTAVLFTNSFRSALLARLAGAGRRVGYDRDGRGLLLTDKLLADKSNGKFVPGPMVRYYNAIARYLGARDLPPMPELFTTPEEEAFVQRTLDRHGIKPRQPIVVLNPGASYGSAKCWLPARFGEAADALIEAFGAAVFVSCGPKELEIGRSVIASMRNPATLLVPPDISLGALKALVRRCDLLITNDTGPRHFGVAFNVPVVTLFGSSDPQWTDCGHELERQLMVGVHCGPCMKRVCPLDHRCMTRLTTEMVLDACRPLLAERLASVGTADRP